MDLQEKWRRGREGYQLARFQFVVTELDLAIAFAERALSSGNGETAHRNILLAREAYGVANRFLSQGSLTWEMKKEIHFRIAKLNRISRQLPSGCSRLF